MARRNFDACESADQKEFLSRIIRRTLLGQETTGLAGGKQSANQVLLHFVEMLAQVLNSGNDTFRRPGDNREVTRQTKWAVGSIDGRVRENVMDKFPGDLVIGEPTERSAPRSIRSVSGKTSLSFFEFSGRQ